MKNPDFPLRKAYFELIKAATGLPVHDRMAPNEAGGNYILLTVGDGKTANTKDSFGHRKTVTIDIVTRFQNAGGSSKVAEDIAEDITEALFVTPDVPALSVDGFRVETAEVQTQPLELKTPVEAIYRLILTLTHTLYQL